MDSCFKGPYMVPLFHLNLNRTLISLGYTAGSPESMSIIYGMKHIKHNIYFRNIKHFGGPKIRFSRFYLYWTCPENNCLVDHGKIHWKSNDRLKKKTRHP